MELHVWEIPVLRDIDHILSDQAVERVYTEGVDYDYWKRDRGDLILFVHRWFRFDDHPQGGAWRPTVGTILVHGSYLKVIETNTAEELDEIERSRQAYEARHAEADTTSEKLTQASDDIELQAPSYCQECLVDLRLTDHTATCETGKLLRRGNDMLAGRPVNLDKIEESIASTEKNESMLGLNATSDAAPIASNDEIFGADSVVSMSGENKTVEPLVIAAEPDGTQEKTTVLVVDTPKTIVTLPPIGTEGELNKVLDRLTDEDAIEVELKQRAAEREQRARELGDTGHNQFQDVKAGKADFDHGAI